MAEVEHAYFTRLTAKHMNEDPGDRVRVNIRNNAGSSTD